MTDSSTSALSDFFTLKVDNYLQFVADYNHQSWPLQISSLIICLWLLWLLHQNNRSKTVCRIMAACWIWVGVYFHYHFYLPLTPLASIYAVAFVVQGLLFIWLSSKIQFYSPYFHRYSKIGYAGLACCMLLPTLAASFSGQSWWHIPLVGMMPTPTALATLSLLLLTGSKYRGLLAVIAFCWCMIAGITAMMNNMPWWFVAPLAAIAACGLIIAERRKPVEVH
ncbi:DUF6064 family protein [Neptunicella sp. SCSIO 80796]|uniref:DUF6064 family protein n=1 Tax=Neptunicella plasticusilytica TaxID=3117012 RepID=UPI003A4D39CC